MGGTLDLPVINVTVDLEQNGSTSREITDERALLYPENQRIILRAEGFRSQQTEPLG